MKQPSSGVASTSSVAFAEAALAQPPVGEEGELDRRDRALDRHVDDVDHEAAAVEALQRLAERRPRRSSS